MASLAARALAGVAQALDRRFGWHRLPKLLAIPTLVGLRAALRRDNLHDTGLAEAPEELRTRARDSEATSTRTLDGTLNDLGQPLMGAIGSRFGRNVRLEDTWPEEPPSILEPNPRLVSRELLTRDPFIPATTLNVLAAAWLQFEVHDWFSHHTVDADPWRVELEPDDPWHERPMAIKRLERDPGWDPAGGDPPTYVTHDSHWWDGSQIYGTDAGFADAIRTREDGKLRLDEDGLPPRDVEESLDLSGPQGNFWIGLGVLHTLFMAEHNAICDRLKQAYPTWSDDRLYRRARLINAALMAKIHTVEWTPAVIAHPTTVYAMKANWYGLLGKRLGKRTSSEVLGGIPGSKTEHHGVPYSLTEEFVAVYRMHPLLPDDFVFRSLDGKVIQECTFRELGARDARRQLVEMGMPSVAHSLGTAHPGAITLHNYPRFLQEFRKPDGTTVDLAAIDVLRIRETGVPRYNDFRRRFRLRPAASFEELSDNPEWVDELRRVYDGDVERVDLMIGLYAERPPPGFGFSDTAFRVFILMASRRLKSDRFFTRDYTPEVYTREGLEWIDDSTMVSVLRRHYPELEPSLAGVENAFAPWR